MLKLTDVTWLYQHLPMRFSLSVRQGEMIAVLGPSGAGKSTLLNLIAGFLQPASGSIVIENRDHTRTPPARRPVSMLFQENNLFMHLTVRQNIALGMDPGLKLNDGQRQKLELIAAQMGITAFIDRLPEALSGGQRQRAWIAMVLAHETSIMLLDEPTSALDPEMVQEVLDVIKSLAETNMTIVMVTHEMGLAREAADKVVFMENGLVVDQGTPHYLFDETDNARVKSFLSKIL